MKGGNSLKDLRSHLFDVIERLKEGNDPNHDPKDAIDIDRAREINKTAQTVINAAKVEVDAWKVIAENGENTSWLTNSGLLNKSNE